MSLQPPAPAFAARSVSGHAAFDLRGAPVSSDTTSVSTHLAESTNDATQTEPEAIPMAAITAARLDSAAFAPVYDQHFPGIFRFCLARLGNPADAEDATSHVFTQALAAVGRFTPRSDLPEHGVRAWLFRIAHNTIANQRRGHRQSLPLDGDAARSVPTQDLSPEDQAIQAEQRALLRSALEHLSEDQRRVIELRLAGLTGTEIAAVLNKRHGAVRMLQSRALDRLRDALLVSGYVSDVDLNGGSK